MFVYFGLFYAVKFFYFFVYILNCVRFVVYSYLCYEGWIFCLNGKVWIRKLAMNISWFTVACGKFTQFVVEFGVIIACDWLDVLMIFLYGCQLFWSFSILFFLWSWVFQMLLFNWVYKICKYYKSANWSWNDLVLSS